MAAVVKFRRDTTDLNLLDTSGFQLDDPGWEPRIATPVYGARPGAVEEVLECTLIGTSHDDIATNMQALDFMRVMADEYMRDRMQEHPVWMHAQLSGETNGRRALVHGIAAEWMSPHYSGEMVGLRPRVELGVVRDGLWEATSAVTMPGATPTAGASVVYDYTASPGADVVGDVPARISNLKITNSNITQLWMGARSANKHGTLANFEPIWDCADTDCTLGTDASRNADANASGGNRVTVSPGTATWAKRLTMVLDDITSNYDDNYGRFLWLLRAATGTSSTWEVQLRHGYDQLSDSAHVQGPIVEIDGSGKSSSYFYSEMGVREIPLLSIQADATTGMYERSNAIQSWARRTSGSDYLYLDCLCPIPVDEGYLIASGLKPAGAAGWVFYTETPKGDLHLFSMELLVPNSRVRRADSPISGRLTLPVGDGRLVIVYSRGTSTLSDQITICGSDSGRYYPRWLSLRGSE